MNCRSGCGACCIAPSISSPIPGMPHGKPAGLRCVQLTADLRCTVFDDPRRPAVCASLRPSQEMCGEHREQALEFLARLERCTAPDAPLPQQRAGPSALPPRSRSRQKGPG
jgi:Fe-S-cluster containining protein